MKLSSVSNPAEPQPGRAVPAEVVASEGGRSLVMVNGRPVHVDGEFQAGQQVNGRLAATAGGFSIIAADNSEGVSAEKLLQNAGLHESGPQLTAAFKSYGVPLTGENLQLAAELLKQLPEAAGKPELIALLIARKLPAGAAPLLLSYFSGKSKFAALFASLEKSAQASLQASWGQGRLVDALLAIIRDGQAGGSTRLQQLAGKLEDWVAGLQLQEAFSSAPDGSHEGRIYFQWPVFWHDRDVPDTLEGEAFIPAGSEDEPGFSLRLLVNPPALGQVEVALNQQQRSLWVHFGVAEQVVVPFKTIFADIRERLLASGDYDQIRLTIGKVRLLNNFFSTRTETVSQKPAARIDLKV